MHHHRPKILFIGQFCDKLQGLLEQLVFLLVMLELMVAFLELMILFESPGFVIDELVGIFTISDCILLAVEDLYWEFELIPMHFDKIHCFEDVFGHFNRHERQHHSIIKYCVQIFSLLRQRCWVHPRVYNKVRQILS